MNVVTVKKAVVKTTVPNTNSDTQTTISTKAIPATTATPVKVAGRPRTNNNFAINQKALFLSIRDVQKYYLPMLSLKHIRKIVNNNVHTIKAGNKLLVNREQLETLLRNPEIKTI